jgi:5-hydroxyisourate hydrolase
MLTIIKKLVDIVEPRWHDGDSIEEGAMGRLTTHVLDTARGKPGTGIALTLYRVDRDGTRIEVAAALTNADGRCDQPLLEGAAMVTGVYDLVFAVSDYLARSGAQLPDPPFVGEVVLRFGVAEPDQHYHVPLLVSPWSYSTYRGS